MSDHQNSNIKTSNQANNLSRAFFLEALSESLFITLPLVVFLIIYLYKNHTFFELLTSPEWSFAASILFGQTIVKLVSGSVHIEGHVRDLIACAITLLIVLGLVPSLITLTFIINAELDNTEPVNWAVWMQLTLFVMGELSFLMSGIPKILSRERVRDAR